MNKPVEPGDILIVRLPSHLPKAHEQEGERPVVVVGLPTGSVRYPVVVVVPLTTQAGAWALKNPPLYPRLPQGAGNIPRASVALLDQVRSLDMRRVAGYLGSLKAEEYALCQNGLKQLFRL